MLVKIRGRYAEYLVSETAQASFPDTMVAYARPAFRLGVAWVIGRAWRTGNMEDRETWQGVLKDINPHWVWDLRLGGERVEIWINEPRIIQGPEPPRPAYAGKGPVTEGTIACKAHRAVAMVDASGPTGSTPALPCGCLTGVGDHRISNQIAVLARGAHWTAF
jgi:hypothetical protein